MATRLAVTPLGDYVAMGLGTHGAGNGDGS
jgi:hypothetical protein